MTTCIMRTGKKVRDKSNNAGYTLVELMVVIAIMAVLLGIAGLSVSLLFSKDAAQTASTIDNELTEARMLSMSRPGAYKYILHTGSNSIDIIKYDDDIMYANSKTVQTIELRSNVTITVEQDGGSLGTDDISFLFDKANGSVKFVNDSAPVSSSAIFINVKANRGTQKESLVTLIPTTGRHYMNK